MEIADQISDRAAKLALENYQKKFEDLTVEEQNHIVLIAENEILGIWYGQEIYWVRQMEEEMDTPIRS